MFENLINRFFNILPYSFEFIFFDFYEKLIENFDPCWIQVTYFDFINQKIKLGEVIYAPEFIVFNSYEPLKTKRINQEYFKIVSYSNWQKLKIKTIDGEEYEFNHIMFKYYRYDSFYNIKKPVKRISKIRG